MPSRLEEFAGLISGLLHGPFEPPAEDVLESQLRASVDSVWMGLQCEVLTDEILRQTSGGGSSQWSQGYLRALLDIDFMRGTVAAGLLLVDDDAEIRDSYCKLARLYQSRGDIQRAALYSFTAVNTLPLEIEAASGFGFTRRFRLHQIMLEATANSAIRDFAPPLQELLTEFQSLLPEWRKLEVLRSYEVERLSRRASEGIAVWRELNCLRLKDEGKICSLTKQKLSAQRRQYYMGLATDNPYRLGFEQAEEVEHNLGSWLLASHIAPTILLSPLEMLANRVPVDSLRTIEKASLWAPDARLERLATIEVGENELGAILTAVHQNLDMELPGIVGYARASLAASQESAK